MLTFLLITAIIIAVLAVVFALQNAALVSVSFLFWSFEASLALVLLLTFLVGAVASMFIMLSWMLRSKAGKRGKEEEHNQKNI